MVAQQLGRRSELLLLSEMVLTRSAENGCAKRSTVNSPGPGGCREEEVVAVEVAVVVEEVAVVVVEEEGAVDPLRQARLGVWPRSSPPDRLVSQE